MNRCDLSDKFGHSIPAEISPRPRFGARSNPGIWGLLTAMLLLVGQEGPSSFLFAAQSFPATSSCVLSAGTNRQPNEGPTDYILHVRPVAKLPAAMIFVDFPDAPHTEETTELYNLLVPNAVQWSDEVSYGRMSLQVTAVHKWYRMRKNSAEYGFTQKMPSLTFEQHRAYIAEAIAISDRDVNYGDYPIVFVVASKDADIPVSPAFHAYPGRGIAVDGTEIRRGATFGGDIRRRRRNHGSHILIHEVGHLIGLPDAHDWQSFGLLNRKHVGGWDVMSSIDTGAHFLAWHKWKLGWLEPDQIHCLLAAEAVEETITPLEIPGGLKAIVIPIGASSAYVVEVRQPIGQDKWLCDKGVLIYMVDAAVRNGSGPVRLKTMQAGKDLAKVEKCDLLYDAPFDIGTSEVSTFHDPDLGVTIEVLSRAGDSYRLRVSKRPASER